MRMHSAMPVIHDAADRASRTAVRAGDVSLGWCLISPIIKPCLTELLLVPDGAHVSSWNRQVQARGTTAYQLLWADLL